MKGHLSVVLSALLVAPGIPAQETQSPKALNIVIVEGEGAINNVRQRVAREPIVQVEDENHKPVAGAVVLFMLPGSGPGGAFPGGANSLSVVTGPDGKAVARGLKPNSLQGQFQIRVTASFQGLSATKTINMVNSGVAAGLSSTAIWTIVAIAGAAAAGGIILGMNSGGPAAQPGKPPVSVTPGTPVVTPPR